MAAKVVVMVGTPKGAFFFESDLSRKKWKMTGPHLGGWEVSAIHMDNYNGSRRIYAGTTHYSYGATIRTSDDMGKTWQQLEGRPGYPQDKGWKTNRIWQITANPSDPKTIYAGIDEAGLFASADRGQTWSEMTGLTNQPDRVGWFPGAGGLCLHTIVFDHSNPNRIWAGISAAGIYRSDDAGKSWQEKIKGLECMESGVKEKPLVCCIHKIVQDPVDPHTLYAQHHPGIYKSTDGGDNWTKIEKGLPGNFGFPIVITKKGDLFIVPLTSNEERYVKDGKFRVYRSTNRGKSWHACVKGLPEQPTFAGVLRDAMCGDGLDDAGVYVGTTAGEVWYTNNAGEKWAKLPGILPRVLCVRAYVVGANGKGRAKKSKKPTKRKLAKVR